MPNYKIHRLTKFAYISFLIMWSITLIGELLYLFFTHNLSLDIRGDEFGFTDFVHFYLAGKITLSPMRHLFYSWEAQKQLLATLTHCTISGEDFYTPYLPIVFIMMAPFSLLPMEFAHLLFDFINTSIGLLGCFLLIKHFNWQNNQLARLIVLGALASMPSWNTWLLGQISWLYLGLICLYIVSLFEKKDLLASFALALTIIKPQYAIFLLIPALCLLRFRLLLYTVGWEIFFTYICSLVFGLKALILYPFVLNQNESSLQSVHAQVMFCVRPFLELLFTQQAAYRYCVSLTLAALLFTALLGFYGIKKNKNKNTLIWIISLTILAALLFSPHAHSHDALLITLPALLTLPGRSLIKTKRSLSANLWRWIYYLSPLISWTAFWLIYAHLPGNLLFTIFVAILFLCALRQLWLQIHRNSSTEGELL